MWCFRNPVVLVRSSFITTAGNAAALLTVSIWTCAGRRGLASTELQVRQAPHHVALATVQEPALSAPLPPPPSSAAVQSQARPAARCPHRK